MLTLHTSPRELGAITDHWTTSKNVVLEWFFMLMSEDFIVCAWNNGSCYTILPELLCTNIKIGNVHLILLLGS